MRRSSKFFALLLALLLLIPLFSSCGEEAVTYMDFPSSYPTNGLKITAAPTVRTENGAKITTIRVTLEGLIDKALESRLASEIQNAVDALEKAPFADGWGASRVIPASAKLQNLQMNVYVVANFGDKLSLVIKKNAVYLAYGEEAAVAAVDTLNYDLKTGDRLTLSSLFESDFDACGVLGEKLIGRLAAGVSGVTQIAPIGKLPDDADFTFDGEKITLYASEKTPSLLADPHEFPAVELFYDSDLFSHLVIFDHESTDSLYDEASDFQNLIIFPTRIAESYTGVQNGMEIRALAVLPEEYASAEVEARVTRLAPSLEDIASQATGAGNEHYSCYFYAQRIGKFMTVRLAEEDYSGMNGYSSDRIYVFDAVTAENLAVTSLFTEGFDYCSALAEILYPEASAGDLRKEAKALALAQIVPREDHFLVRYTAAARELSVLYQGADGTAPYSLIGHQNLTIYN